MYTRERRGVYRSAEGFDTVAKSEGLDNNFVKKILHPFCVYDAPAELISRGEKDESRYPSALHIFHTENGETVVGCNRYQATDFTGQRSAFFAHNFVVPAARADEIIRNYGDWLHADFAGEFRGEPGMSLPELNAIPVGRRERPREPLAVLKSLKIDESLFKGLLQAIMTAVAGKKKIYVALDVPIEELTVRATELMEILYQALPHEFRRRLGVITYANEPKSRKYIHLTFVEKGSLRQGDRSIEKDFVFDLVSGRTANIDFGEQRQPYADFAWNALGHADALEDFGRFAEDMLQGENVERKSALAVYNELAVFYEIEQGNEALYENHKSAVLSGLLSYLTPNGALDRKVRLNDLFLERFDREFDLIRRKGVLVPAIMESFKAYFLLNGHTYKGKIVDYFINGMLNSQAADQGHVVSEAYSIIESNDELSRAFFTKLLAQPVFRRTLFEPYIESRLSNVGRAVDISSFVVRWDRFLPEALQQPFVQDAVRDYLLEKLQFEKDSIAVAAAIHEIVLKAEKDRRKGTGLSIEAVALLQMMEAAAERYLLHQLSLEELSQEQLLEIPFVHYPRGAAEWDPPLDYVNKRKANVLRTAYRWFGEEKPNELILVDLSPQELDDVQLLGRRWLKEASQLEPFERLPLAFYHSQEREGGPLDYDALLELIRRKAGSDQESIYRFLAWSQGNPLFILSNKKLHSGYRKAILRYFLSHDREAFKNKSFRKKYVGTAGPALQSIYNEASVQLASPMTRWIRRSRFPLLISGSVLGIVILSALIVINILNGSGKETALPESTPAHTADGQNVDSAPAAVFLKNTLGSNGERSSQLVFKFVTANDCLQFNPEEISVESAEVVTASYEVSAIWKSCVTPSPGASDVESDEKSAGEADKESVGESDVEAEEKSAGEANKESVGESNAEAEREANGSSSSPYTSTATASLESSPFWAEVTIDPKATLVKGSMIKAAGYSLILMGDPDTGAGAGTDAGTDAGAGVGAGAGASTDDRGTGPGAGTDAGAD